MNKSPIHPKYEHQDYFGYDEFDPHTDFAQFLTEARKHAGQDILEESAGKTNVEAERKSRNPSWKRSFFSWLKREKKSKNSEEAPRNSNISKARRDYVSGVVRGSGDGTAARPRKPLSGPITSLFNGVNQEENNEVPYMCLQKMNTPKDAQSYGPVYLVT